MDGERTQYRHDGVAFQGGGLAKRLIITHDRKVTSNASCSMTCIVSIVCVLLPDIDVCAQLLLTEGQVSSVACFAFA